MRNPIPPIHEEVSALQERLHHEPDGHQKPRVQRLDRLASQQAHTRPDVARRLGVHRHPIGCWLAIYAAGGLAAMLETYIPMGKPVSLAPVVLASLEQALHRAEGFASYEALRQWVARTHGVQIKDKTLYPLECTRCHTKLNLARPTHTQTP